MRSTDSGFSETVYLEAARERIQTAQRLLHDMQTGVDNTARHDVIVQAEDVGVYNGMMRRERERAHDLLNEVRMRWQNNHRYRSERALRDFVTRNRLFIVKDSQSTRSDAVEYSTTRLVDAAAEIIEIGMKQWQLPPNL